MKQKSISSVFRGLFLVLSLWFLSVPSPADAVTVTAQYVTGAVTVDPADPVWSQVTETAVPIDQVVIGVLGVPITTGWRFLWVKAVHNGTDIFFNFQWLDDTYDFSVDDPMIFADAIAMQFPIGNMLAPLDMGTQSTPVNIIFWRADLPQPQNIVAGGGGTVQKSPDAASQNIVHSQLWAGGVWTVVMARPLLAASVNQVSFVGGTDYYIAFANWDGGKEGERDGVKMVTGNWHSLHVQ